MYYKPKAGEFMRYCDVTSLYPWVCKYGQFPVGHPTVITENFASIDSREYHGLIKCKVLPPRRLFHPVLPLRGNGKLLMPLCKLCSDLHQDKCDHSDAERCFWGTWTTLEVYKAMDVGYKVIYSLSCNY